MWRITLVRTVIVTLSSVLVATGSLWMPRAHLMTPYVDLAYSAPDAVVNKDGSWTVKVQSPNAIFGQIACTGNYVAPEIATRGASTAVHYGIKFFCTDPVQYSIRIGLDDFYETGPGAGGAVARRSASGNPRAYEERGGVSPQPFLDGFSRPCVNNQNSGFEIWDQSTLGASEKHNARSARTTVGCRV